VAVVGEVGREELVAVTRAAFGGRRRLVGVARLGGASKKGVYRLSFGDESTAIVYSWDPQENYWPTAGGGEVDYADPFSHASGIELFEAAHRHLSRLGVRVPEVFLADRRRELYPADVAVIEDVPGDNLERSLDREPTRAAPVLRQLAETLGVMHGYTSPRFGKVAWLDKERASRGGSCEQIVLERALADLGEAAGRDARMTDARDRLDGLLRRLAAEVGRRSEYGLIHGELGGDHVLVDRHGRPVIIDIEGVMFFDVEWEHAFLRLRFTPEQYRRLDPGGLDEQRLCFYKLAMHLSLVAGPLRLLDGHFPDREFMMGIAEHHLQEALIFQP
jgi:tRNA A-37 threonylcarbamoyl transferase component Bud32